MERKSIIYYNEAKHRYVNISVVFIITTVLLYTVLFLVCSSPEGKLWRSLYFNTILTLFWTFSLIIKKPLALEFFTDFDILIGKHSLETAEFYNSNKILSYFYGLTAFFAFCSCIESIVWLKVIMSQWINSYYLIIVSINIFNWILLALQIMATAIVICKIKKIELFNSRLYNEN